MNYWIIFYTQLWKDPSCKQKMCDLPKGTIVQSTTMMSVGTYSFVIYQASKEYSGWVYTPYLEELTYLNTECVLLPKETISDQDLAQFVVWDARVQYNLCGQICLAYIYGKSLPETLTTWKENIPSHYRQVMPGGISMPTGMADLIAISNTLGTAIHVTVRDAFTDKKFRHQVLSPNRLLEWIQDGYQPIFGVSVERQYGRLRPSGIAHWIVVDNVIIDGPDNGLVLLYNPASNRVETYSWYEFVSSVKTPTGVMLKVQGE